MYSIPTLYSMSNLSLAETTKIVTSAQSTPATVFSEFNSTPRSIPATPNYYYMPMKRYRSFGDDINHHEYDGNDDEDSLNFHYESRGNYFLTSMDVRNPGESDGVESIFSRSIHEHSMEQQEEEEMVMFTRSGSSIKINSNPVKLASISTFSNQRASFIPKQKPPLPPNERSPVLDQLIRFDQPPHISQSSPLLQTPSPSLPITRKPSQLKRRVTNGLAKLQFWKRNQNGYRSIEDDNDADAVDLNSVDSKETLLNRDRDINDDHLVTMTSNELLLLQLNKQLYPPDHFLNSPALNKNENKFETIDNENLTGALLYFLHTELKDKPLPLTPIDSRENGMELKNPCMKIIDVDENENNQVQDGDDEVNDSDLASYLDEQVIVAEANKIEVVSITSLSPSSNHNQDLFVDVHTIYEEDEEDDEEEAGDEGVVYNRGSAGDSPINDNPFLDHY